jgi:hypothetical protein
MNARATLSNGRTVRKMEAEQCVYIFWAHLHYQLPSIPLGFLLHP